MSPVVSADEVLILILLEYGLRLQFSLSQNGWLGLNPYSIGIWSATPDSRQTVGKGGVLILILLEYGLRLLKSQIIDFQTLKT